MVNPTLSKGFAPISHDLLRALTSAGLSGLELSIVLTVIDWTCGWQRESAEISMKEMMQATRARNPRTVQRAVRRLKEHGILVLEYRTGRPTVYSVNKDYDTWGDDKIVAPADSPPDASRHYRDDPDAAPGMTKMSSHTLLEKNLIKKNKQHAALPLLLSIFLSLNGKAKASENDRETARQLEGRSDYDESLAVQAMTLCHSAAIARDEHFRAGSLSYYVPAITQALARGEVAIPRKGGGHGEGRVLLF